MKLDDRPAQDGPEPPNHWSGLPWLPDRPHLNPRPLRLHLRSTWSPAQVAVEGLPSAALCLVGWLDAQQAGQSSSGDHLIQIQAEPGTAVHLASLDGKLPPQLQHLSGAPGAYLLPAGWLDRVRLIGAHPSDGSGEASRTSLPVVPLMLRCGGARHGTDGLPDDVVRWPRRTSAAYAVVAGPPEGDFLPILARRPGVRSGHRLIRFRVEPGYAIDVTATAARLATLTSVRSRITDLRASGVGLMLPRRAFGRVPITRVFEASGRSWRRYRTSNSMSE
ncbi:hypothetical protein HCA58_14015 [Micromonospora sp. HNM0581]|uniref:hypothetical protein n=1 Tax=Micromonospora sp. HNM0581 TaxID=2716341 RepID=UPI00146E7CCA|nr:hypothetical protein [Micromonospora sp. HNM0581]NLU79477.1 hypothetical protein [Micromonospora sp. HNM0581]